MSARDTLIGILRQWAEHHGAAPITPEALVDASDAELLREWAAKVREVGTAKGWSTWAAAFMDPDTEFVDTAMPSTETIVAELRRLDRVQTLRDAADWFERACPDVEALLPVCMCHAATELRGLADRVAEEKDTSGGGQPSEGESTPAFFQPDHTYTDGNGYTAPELITVFRVEHVTRHPDRGHLRAIGWSRSGEPGSGWHGDFRDEGEFDGWTDVTEGTASDSPAPATNATEGDPS